MRLHITFLCSLLLFCCRPNKDLDTPDGGSLKIYNAKSKRTIYTFTDEMPQFPGGESGFIQLLLTNMRLENRELDSFRVDFMVEVDGRVADIKISARRGAEIPGADQIMRDVMGKIPKWKPGKLKGKIVPVKICIPVSCVKYD